MSARLYPYGRHADSCVGSPNRYAYFVKRVGLRWEIWHEHEDGHADPNGSAEWRAVWGVKFWRSITALRVAADMQQAHYDGGWMELVSSLDEVPA